MWLTPTRLRYIPVIFCSNVRLKGMNRYIKSARERGDFNALEGLLNRIPVTLAVELDEKDRIVSLARHSD